MVHFFFYLVDEDKGDERGEIFLGETSYVTNEGARINRYQDHENHGDPGADPKTERHVFPVCFAVEIFTLLQIILWKYKIQNLIFKIEIEILENTFQSSNFKIRISNFNLKIQNWIFKIHILKFKLKK